MQLSLDLNIKNEIPKILLSNKKPIMLDFLPDDCVIVDIETTGFSAQNDSIIEICALKVVENKVVDEFSSLIKPDKKISSYITNLTGITMEMTQNAPELKTVLNNFCEFIQTNPIVGHNIKFDLSFLNKKLDNLYNKILPNDFSDTLIFARKTYKELNSHKLANIAKYLNIDTTNAHRALKDCYMTYQIIKDIKIKMPTLQNCCHISKSL